MANNKEYKGRGVLIVSIIILAVFILLYFLLGVRSFFNILKWFIIILFVLAIFGTVVYFVWYFFFKKQKFDVTYVNKQKLLDACHKGNTGVMKGLYLSGDKGHSRHFWGNITGYARISVLTRKVVYKKDKNGFVTDVPETVLDEDSGKEEVVYETVSEEQDVFSVSHSKVLGRLFEEEDVVRVSPSSHDELLGDVTIFGFSLLPLSEYWFLNSDYLDVRMIDYTILKEAERGIMFTQQADFKHIVDKASGLDTDHQKRIEEKSLYELPINQGK